MAGPCYYRQMARTLSDTLIIAMIEAATRLAGGRGPVSGAGSPSTQTTQAGEAAPTGTGATITTATEASATSQPSSAGSSPSAGEHDNRSAEQIAADFRTIYLSIEEVVKTSAEQETKPVGFGIR